MQWICSSKGVSRKWKCPSGALAHRGRICSWAWWQEPAGRISSVSWASDMPWLRVKDSFTSCWILMKYLKINDRGKKEKIRSRQLYKFSAVTEGESVQPKPHSLRSENFIFISEVTQSCPTLCDPMDSSLPGSSIHGIFQARVLEWVAISFSRGSSRPKDRTRVSLIAGRRFTVWATRESLA